MDAVVHHFCDTTNKDWLCPKVDAVPRGAPASWVVTICDNRAQAAAVGPGLVPWPPSLLGQAAEHVLGDESFKFLINLSSCVSFVCVFCAGAGGQPEKGDPALFPLFLLGWG